MTATNRPGSESGRSGVDITWGTPAARWVVAATVLGSGVVFLDSTVVNVALPAIGEDLGADVAGLQWTANGYLVTLASLILLGGSLGDRFGRRRVFQIGLVWFAVASLVCAVAPNVGLLVAARALQGVGGALLTPGSLAILEASFAAGDRAKAIGAWSGLAGVSTAIGPLVGGWLVDSGSWRLIFLLNLPLIAATLVIAARHVPESSDPQAARQLDVAGAVLAAGGLGLTTWALIAAGERGVAHPSVVASGVAGAAALVAFIIVEARSRHPMMPLSVFSSRQFSAANVVTFAVYAALGASMFLLVVHLQQVVGYGALQAGVASLPLTVVMLLLSARAGALAQRIGPRLPMTVGPLLVALGLLLLSGIGPNSAYVSAVLPGVLVLGLGLAVTVAPLTATVLAAVDARFAGLASGVNNAVARAAQLGAVAVLPVVAGLTGDAYTDPVAFEAGYRTAMRIAGGLAAVGGIIAFATIQRPLPDADETERPEPQATPQHYALSGPPMDRCPRAPAPAGGRR